MSAGLRAARHPLQKNPGIDPGRRAGRIPRVFSLRPARFCAPAPAPLVKWGAMYSERSMTAAPDSAESIDAALMGSLVHGNRDALAALYDRHASAVLALGVRILRDRSQAEELLHDIFLEAWHHAADFDSGRGTVRAWLLIRTRSRALDRRAARLRHERLAEQAALVPSGIAGSTSGAEHGLYAGASMDAERVRRQMARLPEELFAVLELAYFEGFSCSAIAEKLEIPIGTVKSRMARALSQLRQQIGVTGEGMT
jgi:RNA polymerase sigma-70 factor (ECF subfamily)